MLLTMRLLLSSVVFLSLPFPVAARDYNDVIYIDVTDSMLSILLKNGPFFRE